MVRSTLFNVAFYVVTGLMLVFLCPLLVCPRSWAMAALKLHARIALWLQRVIVGTRFEVRGLEHLPVGPVLVASKHQSAWDTFALIPLLRDPALIMKAELMRIPFYGWFSRKFAMIPIRRERRTASLRELIRESRERAEQGREIVIFPEGSRRSPGAPPDFKPGVLLLYDAMNLPCCPVALNSGLFWPRRHFSRYPGTIVVEFLEPIEPGLERKIFRARLESSIEDACDRLLVEAANSASPPPLPQSARQRLTELGEGHRECVQKENIC